MAVCFWFEIGPFADGSSLLARGLFDQANGKKCIFLDSMQHVSRP